MRLKRKKSVSAVDEKLDVLWGMETELSESEGEDSEEEKLKQEVKELKKKLKQCKVKPKDSSGKVDAVSTQPSVPPLPPAYEEEDWKWPNVKEYRGVAFQNSGAHAFPIIEIDDPANPGQRASDSMLPSPSRK